MADVSDKRVAVPMKNENILDKAKTFKLGPSEPEAGQIIFLYSYALDPNPKGGVYGVIKPIGMYKDEAEAEKRLIKELDGDFAKTFKIGKSGQNFLLKDPAALQRQEFDKVVSVENEVDKTTAKRIIAAQKVRVKETDDKDKRDIEEQERLLMQELAKEVDPNRDRYTYDDYCILRRKLIDNPAEQESLKAQIARMIKEIQKLEVANEKNKKDIIIFNEKHPEFDKKLKEDIEMYKNIQKGSVA